MDTHGNTVAREGCDRCFCGCKYWEHDRCIDCGTSITDVAEARRQEVIDNLDTRLPALHRMTQAELDAGVRRFTED